MSWHIRIAAVRTAIVAALLSPAVFAAEPNAVAAASESRGWEYGLSLNLFDLPEEGNYPFAIVTADRGPWHIEGRYQYEDYDTASLFLGRNLAWGDDVQLELVPMLGVIAGATDGFALGLETTLSWHGLEWYGESELVFPAEGDSYVYLWHQLTYAPTDAVQFGLLGQRTRVFEQDAEVDVGLLLGVSFSRFEFDLYAMNPHRDDPYLGVGLQIAF